jgi:hypothetical protein
LEAEELQGLFRLRVLVDQIEESSNSFRRGIARALSLKRPENFSLADGPALFAAMDRFIESVGASPPEDTWLLRILDRVAARLTRADYRPFEREEETALREITRSPTRQGLLVPLERQAELVSGFQKADLLAKHERMLRDLRGLM